MSAHLLDSFEATTAPVGFFDSEAVERLISDYQRTGSVQTLGQVIEACQPMSLCLIRGRRTTYYEEEELLSSINRKLLISLPLYDSRRGSAFSFVFRLSQNMLRTAVAHRKKLDSRHQVLTEPVIATTADDKCDLQSQLAVAHLTDLIRSVKSSCTLQSERDAQKWLIESFLDCGFLLRRHEIADAAMRVFSLSHRRARDLFDITLLAVRQTVYAQGKHPPINPAQLAQSKDAWCVRYRDFLTIEEFPRFAALVHGLPPLVIVLVRPANRPGIRARDWEATRQNLRIVLEGDPSSTPLFEG